MFFKFVINSIQDINKRIDVFLSERTKFSRSKIKKAIIDNKLLLNGEKFTRNSYILKDKDKLEITIQKSTTNKLKSQNKELDIIFEDEHLLVVNKEAGLVVHPGSGNHENTLANYLRGYLGEKPYLVHRLDKETSGIIVIAKNEEILNNLQKQWQNRTVKKYYKTLVSGLLDSKSGIIDSPIKRNQKNRQEMSVSPDSDARNAKTYFELEKNYEDCSLLNVQIYTGRTHQIRVHFKAINHPVIGDKTYGNNNVNNIFKEKHNLDRQFLHAYKLEFKHPATNKELVFEIDLAEDLMGVIKEL